MPEGEWKPKRPLSTSAQSFALSLLLHSVIQAILIAQPGVKAEKEWEVPLPRWGCLMAVGVDRGKRWRLTI